MNYDYAHDFTPSVDQGKKVEFRPMHNEFIQKCWSLKSSRAAVGTSAFLQWLHDPGSDTNGTSTVL